MDTSIIILVGSFIIAISGILFFLHAEKNTYTKVLVAAQSSQSEVMRVQRELTETKSRVDDLRKSFMEMKSTTQYDVDKVQEHCARLREQQQLLRKRQNTLHEKMIPQKIEFSIVENPGPAQKNPALIKKIKGQLNELSK